MNVCTISLIGQPETALLGETIGRLLEPGDLIYLDGDLGSGKTTLTKSIARSLGIAAESVTSPTFTLVHEYRAKDTFLYHFDLYRLSGPGELENLGFDDYIDGTGIVIVEWANKVNERLPSDALTIEMTIGSSPDDRSATITSNGERSGTILDQLMRTYSC